MKFRALLGGVCLVGLTALVIWKIQLPKADPQPNMSQTIKEKSEPAQTPLPFAELTIPYLRARNYQSSLGKLEPVGEDGAFTSYLTQYKSDGLQINGLLTKPKGEMPTGGWPAIVFVHGYIAPTIYRTQERYIDHVNTLARNGFVVFKIDLRGHGQSEGEAGGAYYSSDYVIDTLQAYAALQSSDFVNPDKIGLWGHSMAGNVVLRSLAARPEIPAVSIWAGAGFSYEDLQKYEINDASYRPPTSASRQQRREQLFSTHGQFSLNSGFWQQVAATNYLSDVQGAISLHHASNDDVVNINYSRDLRQHLDESKVSHELYEYEQGGHNITGSSFSVAMNRTVEFFKRNL